MLNTYFSITEIRLQFFFFFFFFFFLILVKVLAILVCAFVIFINYSFYYVYTVFIHFISVKTFILVLQVKLNKLEIIALATSWNFFVVVFLCFNFISVFFSNKKCLVILVLNFSESKTWYLHFAFKVTRFKNLDICFGKQKKLYYFFAVHATFNIKP